MRVMMKGQAPCCICGEPIDQLTFDCGEAVANQGRSLVVAHTRHFFVAGTRTADYDANVAKLAKTVVDAEGIPVLNR